jgi:hypothetical protein
MRESPGELAAFTVALNCTGHRRRSQRRPALNQGGTMQTLNDMLDRQLLTTDQHARIKAWISKARTPQAIMEMPPALWRSLTLASVLMDFDADVTQAPLLAAED